MPRDIIQGESWLMLTKFLCQISRDRSLLKGLKVIETIDVHSLQAKIIEHSASNFRTLIALTSNLPSIC